MQPHVIIFGEPTRGIDVGAKQEIYQLMRADHFLHIARDHEYSDVIVGKRTRDGLYYLHRAYRPCRCFLAMHTRSISPASHDNFYELYAIAAAVLGGCSLRGGEGSILGVVLGTILLQVLQNLVNLLGIPSSLNFAVIGGLFWSAFWRTNSSCVIAPGEQE